jgi:hypothetical protein
VLLPVLLHVEVWQASGGVQTAAAPGTQVPAPLQASPTVQPLLSALHDEPDKTAVVQE